MIVPSKIYGSIDVLEAARRRTRWLYRQFDNVIVAVSGGKDSTVCFHLALEAARAEGKLPINVMFLDQEMEWNGTIETVRLMMAHPDVNPLWYQIPFKLSNSTSTEEHWLHVWDEAKRDVWMRPKEAISYKENIYDCDRFHGLLSAIPLKHFNVSKENTACVMGGVRCEESPVRALALTQAQTWKWATWGKAEFRSRGFCVMYPIYDWFTSDVWKYIHENKFHYNPIYDLQFQHGLPIQKMRVSSFHHETAIETLFYVHQFEGATWNAAVRRLKGLHTAEKMGKADYYPTDLPPMFKDWWEYRDYLLEKLITNPKWRETMQKRFARQDARYRALLGTATPKSHVCAILSNDWEGVKSSSFVIAAERALITHKKEQNERAAAKVA